MPMRVSQVKKLECPWKRGDVLPGAHERVLHGVLGRVWVAGDPHEHSPKPWSVALGESLERPLVARPSSGDELGLLGGTVRSRAMK